MQLSEDAFRCKRLLVRPPCASSQGLWSGEELLRGRRVRGQLLMAMLLATLAGKTYLVKVNVHAPAGQLCTLGVLASEAAAGEIAN